MDSPPVVRVSALSKAYGSAAAIADVGFDIAPGEVFGLLGPNGAGKTTTLECLSGLIPPDSGTIQICGVDTRKEPRAARHRLGAVLQLTGLPDAVTPKEALDAFGALHGRTGRTADLLSLFGLKDKAYARVAGLSGGQKQRLAIAIALIDDPAVVVMDEPSAGLDVQARRALHDVIRTLKADGRAILLASHDMDEVEQLCDRVAVLARGRIVSQGRPAQIMAASETAIRVRGEADAAFSASLAASLASDGLANGLSIKGAAFSFSTSDLNGALSSLTARLSSQGMGLRSVRAERGSLEELILHLSAEEGR